MDHVDVVVDVSKTTSAAFGELDFVVDALQNGVCEVGLNKVNDPRPVRLTTRVRHQAAISKNFTNEINI
jgi:hypothetical protein